MSSLSMGRVHVFLGATLQYLCLSMFTCLFINFFINLQVSLCPTCQMYEKVQTMAPEMKQIKVNAPMDLVGIDLISK